MRKTNTDFYSIENAGTGWIYYPKEHPELRSVEYSTLEEVVQVCDSLEFDSQFLS